jgi:hypothetical protein
VVDSEIGTINHASVPEHSEDGVDVTLVHWMLSLTPAERLRFLQERVEDVLAIRRLNAGR